MTRTVTLALMTIIWCSVGVFTQSTRDDAQVKYKIALRALQDDNLRVAVDALRHALRLDPDHAMAHHTLAVAWQTSNPDEALVHLDHGIRLGLPEKEEAESPDLRIQILYQAARLLADQVFTDQETALMWTVRDNGDDIDWAGATAYCGALTLRGFDDWRLPAIQELSHLSDRSLVALYKIKAPLKVSGCCPWSSTKDGSVPMVFAFNFGQAWPFGGPPLNCRALCVRGTK